MPQTKKLWDDRHGGEKQNGKGVFFQNQWSDNAWSVGTTEADKSEHAVSKPINVKRKGEKANNFHQDPQSVTSPRSAEGNLGVCMVEYVLASSPGGQSLERSMKALNVNGTLNSPPSEQNTSNGTVQARNSPYHEQMDNEVNSGLDLKKPQEIMSPHPPTPLPEEEETQTIFSRTPGSRQTSPNPGLQNQDGSQLGMLVQPVNSSRGGSVGTSSSEDHVSSPVQFVPQVDPSSIGIEIPFNYSNVQNQQTVTGISTEGMTPTQGVTTQQQQQQQQQPQLIIGPGHAQQQLGGITLASSPFFVTGAAGEDPYGGGGISIVNANGQTAVISPQYAAAYGIQPWVYANTGNGATFVQQQPQQIQQGGQVGRTPTSASRPAGESVNLGQQLSQPPNGYQVIQGPLSIPAGATFYDQQGNPVIINGRLATHVGGQMGQHVRMVSPMMINTGGGAANVSPGMAGNTSQQIQLFNAQQQQQQAQQQQQRQQQASSINLGYLSSSAGSLGTAAGVQMQNGGPVGVIGGHLSTTGTPPMGTLQSTLQNNLQGTLQGRRDPFGTSDPSKRQSVTQVYPASFGSYNALTVNTPLANALTLGDTNTSPLHNQGSSFPVGSPVNSRFSGYASLLSSQPKYRSTSTGISVGSNIFASSASSIYRRPGRDSGRSKLLEDFRNNRYPNLQLRDLAGHIVEFSQDQHGSRFIQQKLERASVVEKTLVFGEILSAAYSLMTDVFGNYVIQKFFEFGSPEQKMALAHRIKGHVLPLALQMYGCRVIQKALETIPGEIQSELVMELDGHVLKCVKDQNGNHVVQKCIECVNSMLLQFIIDAFRGQVFALSTHPYGCRVIQRILEHCTPEQTGPILGELHENAERLVQDQYGNYVIQHVLEHGSPEDKSAIVNICRGNVVILSQHKFASNVVEKCVSHASRAERATLIDEVCNYNDGPHGALYTMMKDQYANYVVQKMIDVAEPMQKKILMHKIRPHVATLRKFTYGKHILAKLEKLEKSFYMKPNMDLVFLPPNGQPL